jgi:hypothetical protein
VLLPGPFFRRKPRHPAIEYAAQWKNQQMEIQWARDHYIRPDPVIVGPSTTEIQTQRQLAALNSRLEENERQTEDIRRAQQQAANTPTPTPAPQRRLIRGTRDKQAKMPLERPDQQHLCAAHGYIGLGMFEEANAELEEIDPFCHHLPEVLIARVAIYSALKKWELMAARDLPLDKIGARPW